MKAKMDYREIMIHQICDYCAYYDVCGLSPEYDCEAFKKLVKIYEDLDCDNPGN